MTSRHGPGSVEAGSPSWMAVQRLVARATSRHTVWGRQWPVKQRCQANGGARAWKRRCPNVHGAASAWGENCTLLTSTGTPDAGASAGIVDAPILITTQIAQKSNTSPIGFGAL